MTERISIHPRVGIARLGNSKNAFYLGPETPGGLPIECDARGNAVRGEDGLPRPVRRFKDAAGGIKRQAACFKLFETRPDGSMVELTLADPRIARIEWTAHVANKKPIWYTFSELTGDLQFGEWNSYENQHVPLNNGDVTDPAQRKPLMIDPGPRRVAAPGQRQAFSRYTPPEGYKSFSFPPTSLNPAIDSLGEIMMDDDGRLVLLGAFGNSAGTETLTSFRGASNWWDDVSDGYVAATVHFKDGHRLDLEPAWVIVGSPKFAPELVNIVTLDDTAFDVAVRFLGYAPELYDPKRWPADPKKGYDPLAGYNPDYRASFERDIRPIIERPANYRWVAHTPTMADFAQPRFDVRDASERNAPARRRYFEQFRVPVPAESYAAIDKVPNGPNTLMGGNGVPLMPLNSGDNSVTNTLIYKFLTLTPTQYFFLHQWAQGKFDAGTDAPDLRGGVSALDRAVIGNLVGGPFSPGIETTWIVRNPRLYSAPFSYRVAHWSGSVAELAGYYAENGLSLTSDPQNGDGTEPGDLTKRMAIPWQADFFDCTVQTPNAVDASINQSPSDDGVEVPPAYYVYWWPPQSPMHVVAGDMDPGNQVLDGYVSAQPAQFSAINGLTLNLQSTNGFGITAAGQPVTYSRGINSFGQMTSAWKDLGFIVNVGSEDYRNFVESERNTNFLAQGAALGIK
ncbi:MAG TPA: CTQ-dependent lysine 6-oxidase LodA [Burkholderiaceae bacterium]